MKNLARPSSDGLKQIGTLINNLREDHGITQKELGTMIGTTQSVIARIEAGEQNLSTETLSKISRALRRQIITLGKGSLNFEIDGGRTLSGVITTNSSKNGAVGLLCAAILNTGVTTLRNMPRIEEVHRLIEVLGSLGFNVTWKGNRLEIKPPKKIALSSIDVEAARKTRSIIMMIGPLLRYFHTFSLPQSGGCKLGARTVRPHFYALERLGVNIETTETSYEVSYKNLHPGEIVMYESGDTATENAILAAAQIPGVTTIKYASANYQVQELCFFLNLLGVTIEGIGTTTLVVHGKKNIGKDVAYTISEDPTDSMFFIAASIVTNSSIIIERCPIDFLELELLILEKMGFRYKILKRYLAENGKMRLVDIETYPSKLTAPEDKIHARPYPGLNMDNLPFFAVIATQAKGQTLIHDWVYEKRALYYTELDKLGAETVLADPHRIFINGPTQLRPADLTCPPALRPATILLIAMLGAKGRSTLRNVYSINRGYEDLSSKLNRLGAKVRAIQDLS